MSKYVFLFLHRQKLCRHSTKPLAVNTEEGPGFIILHFYLLSYIFIYNMK